jgi:hypothetical protein
MLQSVCSPTHSPKVVGVPPDSATDVDKIVSVVATVLSPRTIMLRLCNAAVQAVACHFLLAPLAPTLGKLAEDALATFLPEDRYGKAVAALPVLAVGYDIGSNQLTATVQDYAAGKLADVVNAETAGITPSELDTVPDERKSPRSIVSSQDLEAFEDVQPGSLPAVSGPGGLTMKCLPIDEPTRDDGPGVIGGL